MYDFERNNAQWAHWGSILNGVFAGTDSKWTIAISVRFESIGALQVLMAKIGTPADGGGEARQFYLYLSAAGQLTVYVSAIVGAAPATDFEVIFTTTTISTATDYRIFLTYDGSIDTGGEDRVECWVNGTQQGKTLSLERNFPFDIQSATAPLTIGARVGTAGGSTGYLDGVVWEPAVWSGLLTADDADTYNDGCSPRLIQPALLEFAPGLVRETRDPISGATATLSASAPTVVAHGRIYMPAPMSFVPSRLSAPTKPWFFRHHVLGRRAG